MKVKVFGLVCFAILMFVSGPALARGPHGHQYHHGHGHHGAHWRASLFVGGGYPAYPPYWGPACYPRPVYYYYPAPAYPVYPAPVAVAPVAPLVAPSFSFSFGR